jgi:hypothetical protein
MWQVTQTRSNNDNNFLSVTNRSSGNNNTNFRQFGRRLSSNLFRVIRRWRSTGNEISLKGSDKVSKYFIFSSFL